MDAPAGLELFQSYEQDLEQLLSSVSDKLGSLNGSAEVRKAALKRCEMELEEADEIIDQMDIEVSSGRFLNDKQLKPKLQVKMRSYKAGLAKRRADIKQQLSTLDRSDLLSGGRFASDDDNAEQGTSLDDVHAQRSRLLKGTDKLQDSSRRLEESHRLALETEDVGAGILGTLRGQREQIQSTRDRLHDADRGIDRASGTLGKMIRRMYQQKVVTGLIVTVLVLLIILVIWSKFR